MCLFVISYNQKREKKSTHSKSRLAKSEIPLEFGFQFSDGKKVREGESTWRCSEPEWRGRSGSAAMQAAGQAAVAGGRQCG